MRKRPGDAGSEAGFSLVELLVVVSIIVIITAIAIGQYAGARTQRVRHEATASLPGLKAWEEAWYERTGSYRFSSNNATDRIRFQTASTNDCRAPYQSTTTTDLSYVAYPDKDRNLMAFMPQGCQFEYYVIPDRCDADCADSGSGDTCDTGNPATTRCFCAIAIGTGTVAKNDRFCIDDLGRQFANVSGMKDWN